MNLLAQPVLWWATEGIMHVQLTGHPLLKGPCDGACLGDWPAIEHARAMELGSQDPNLLLSVAITIARARWALPQTLGFRADSVSLCAA